MWTSATRQLPWHWGDGDCGYPSAAATSGSRPGVRLERAHGETALTEDLLTTLLASTHQWRRGRQRGEAWEHREAHQEFIAQWLANAIDEPELIERILAHRRERGEGAAPTAALGARAPP